MHSSEFWTGAARRAFLRGLAAKYAAQHSLAARATRAVRRLLGEGR